MTSDFQAAVHIMSETRTTCTHVSQKYTCTTKVHVYRKSTHVPQKHTSTAEGEEERMSRSAPLGSENSRPSPPSLGESHQTRTPCVYKTTKSRECHEQQLRTFENSRHLSSIPSLPFRNDETPRKEGKNKDNFMTCDSKWWNNSNGQRPKRCERNRSEKGTEKTAPSEFEAR